MTCENSKIVNIIVARTTGTSAPTANEYAHKKLPAITNCQTIFARKKPDEQKCQTADKRDVQAGNNENVKRAALAENFAGLLIKKITVAKRMRS